MFKEETEHTPSCLTVSDERMKAILVSKKDTERKKPHMSSTEAIPTPPAAVLATSGCLTDWFCTNSISAEPQSCQQRLEAEHGTERVTAIQQQGNIYGGKMLSCACFQAGDGFNLPLAKAVIICCFFFLTATPGGSLAPSAVTAQQPIQNKTLPNTEL